MDVRRVLCRGACKGDCRSEEGEGQNQCDKKFHSEISLSALGVPGNMTSGGVAATFVLGLQPWRSDCPTVGLVAWSRSAACDLHLSGMHGHRINSVPHSSPFLA
jgi:hypothetical protein